jgi:acyl-CoA synthetase (NDP forming)
MMVDFLRRSGFAGRIYPVNPRYEVIGDWKCYPSVQALPETVDVVVVAVPVAHAFDALEQAARRGVPFVVLMTGGFGEGTSGDEGRARLERLRALCAGSGMRVVGPNTVGMVNFRRRMPLTFADWYGRDTGQRGGVAVLTHSGSVGGLIFSSLQIQRVGVDYWIAAGNEANLELADFIDHLSGDAGLHTIACFMEGVMDGRRFMRAVARARAAGKHVVVLKAGASDASLRSTEAHTIKRSSPPDVYRGIFAQLGVVQVRSLAELTYAVKLLASVGARTRGNVGIVSASGGACSLIADHVVDAGLALPELDADTQARLAQSIPDYGSTRNPVDVSADVVSRKEIMDGTFAALRDDATVDTWMIFGRPVIDRYHVDICAFARDAGKAVLVSSGVALRPEVEDALREGGVAALDDPDICLRALGAIHRAELSCTVDAGPGEQSVDAGDRLSELRGTGERVGAAALWDTLRRHGISMVPPRGAGIAHLVVAVRQDEDFGPVVAVERPGPAQRRDAQRIVRALPIAEQGLITALAAPTAIEALQDPARRQALLPLLASLCRLYDREPALAAITLALRFDDTGVQVVDAHGLATEGVR